MAQVAVIGRGLIGSAAARHLAKTGHDVTLIGPSEPMDKATHKGVFASHYDEGRITRKLAQDEFWSQISEASIDRYAEIEAESGVSFFGDVGAMMAGPADSKLARNVAQVIVERGLNVETFDHDGLRAKFPYFDCGLSPVGMYEADQAGYISPRNLVLAQTAAAQKFGAKVVDKAVTSLDEVAEFDHVILAAGAFSNSLLPKPLVLQVYARTVALFEVSEAEVARLGRMPSLIVELDDGVEFYLLPPIRYADGKTYLKLGGDLIDVPLNSADEIKAWFRAGGSQEVVDGFEGWMRRIMPDLQILKATKDACVTMFTAHGKPYVGKISPRLTIATGGNGAGAKCSDELGRLAMASAFGEDDPQTKPVWKG